MNNDGLKEKIGLYKTLITIFWTSFFLLGGGLFNFIYRIKQSFEMIAFGIGSIFELILIILAIGLIFRCKNLIKELMER